MHERIAITPVNTRDRSEFGHYIVGSRHMGTAFPVYSHSQCDDLIGAIGRKLKVPFRSDIIPFKPFDRSPYLHEKQMVLFLKPEVFFPDVKFPLVLENIFEGLVQRGYGLQSLSIIPGPYIAKNGIIDRYYGKIGRALEQDDINDYPSRDTRVVSMVIRSLHASASSTWQQMQDEFIGDPDPSKARSGSLRNSFLIKQSDYGFDEVNPVRNGVHLTLGPVESAAEIVNWISSVPCPLLYMATVMGRMLLSQGYSAGQLVDLMQNPSTGLHDSAKTWFEHTSGLEPQDALDILEGLVPLEK